MDLTQIVDSFSKKVSLGGSGEPDEYILVDRKEDLNRVAKDLAAFDRVAFDAEGVDLSRTGALTVACFQGFDSSDEEKFTPIYVVDVQVLEGDTAFPKTSTELTLRDVLEDPKITKVTFDCRADSDALFHQFQVKLTGTIDLQVFDQAVRIHKGAPPPARSGSWKPFVEGMGKVLKRYPIRVAMDKANAPHRGNYYVWQERPLSDKSIEYAAKDIEVIRKLWYAMNKVNVSELLLQRTKEYSARYEQIFRDAAREITFNNNKTMVMEEVAIISKSELPSDHPCRRGRRLYY